MSDTAQIFYLPNVIESQVSNMMNIQTVCRICANESDRRIEIFSEDGIANDLANKINLYLPIKVTSTDNLPKQCCWQCTSTILAWHNLVLISAEADKRLRSHHLPHKQFENVPYTPAEVDISRTTADNLIKTTLAPACTDTQILVSSPGKITEKARTSTDSDQDNQYLCNICDEAYDRPVSLKQHQRQEHGLAPVKFRRRKCDIPTNTQFQCPYCEKSYSRKHDMEKHARLHHPEEDVPQLKKDFMNVVPASCKVELASGRMQYNCDFCDKSFQKCYNLTRHRTIHTKVNRHCCHLCGKNFRLNSNLIRHINEYHRNLRRFACPTCPMVFKNKNTRDQHVNTHTNSRPFTCDACGKSFRQGSSLYVHKRVHSDIYPFSCMLCGKTFRRKQNLKEHNLIHSGYKPFKCDQCSMAFRQKHELKRHSKCHNTVVCDRCGTYFGQARSLSVHRRKCEQSLEQLSKATE